MAGLEPEFDKRNTKIVGLSRRPGDQPLQVGQGHRGDAGPRRQLSDDRRSRAQGREAYDMLPADAGTTSEGRTAADNATVRSVFIIGPDKKIKAMLTYPMSTGRNFDEVLRLLEFVPAHGQAQGGDAGELEARRGRHHRPGGVRRGRQGKVPRRLESAEALPPHRPAAEGLIADLDAGREVISEPEIRSMPRPRRRGDRVAVRPCPFRVISRSASMSASCPPYPWKRMSSCARSLNSRASPGCPSA